MSVWILSPDHDLVSFSHKFVGMMKTEDVSLLLFGYILAG